MSKISKHFKREEFACKCGKCGQDTVDVVLIEILESVREHFGVSVRLTNANRCAKHNAEVGGATNSQHLKGRAADIQVEGINPDEVADWLDDMYPNQYGIGRYKTFTHIDSRDRSARWDKR